MQFDLLVRGGTIVDGSGGDPLEADIGIVDGKIAFIGKNAPSAREEIDARGKIVTPGFVDIHTHYDGQVTWENRLQPSSQHGVTTALMGNCGVGFAPCTPDNRERLIHLMEGVEDLPEVVLATGLPWTWESFPEYLDFLEARAFDIDVATQVPHAALRVHVMGERAIAHEAATAQDRAAMAALAAQAIAAGALGFATSRTINHRSSEGWLIPTLVAAEAELAEIGRAVGASGRGVLQLISDFADPERELPMLRRIAEAAGRPMSVSLLQMHDAPEKWRQILHWIEQCNVDGLEVRAQVSGRMVGILMGFELTFHPFMNKPSWEKLAALSRAERQQALRTPEMRTKLLSEPDLSSPYEGLIRNYAGIYPVGDAPDYEPTPGSSIAAMAESKGISADEIAYDMMMSNGGNGILMGAGANYASGGLEPQREMLRHAHTVYGLGDGGAHLGFLCDASLPTFMLQHWVRDRTRGERLPLTEVVKGLTSDNARAVGCMDRGLLKTGLKADINVIDLDRLALKAPQVAFDLPAGGRRVTQQAAGFAATIVSGVVTYRDGEATGALPGRLVRGR